MGFNSEFKGLNQREVEFGRCITKDRIKLCLRKRDTNSSVQNHPNKSYNFIMIISLRCVSIIIPFSRAQWKECCCCVDV